MVKKVACVGNMNNMGLPSCLYLQDLGYEVTLFLLNEFDHFLPQNETDAPINLEIIKLGWTEENFSDVLAKEIRAIFKPFDFIIGTDYAPAFLNKAGIKMNIYFPAGTDITKWPFKRSKRFVPQIWEYNYLCCSISQYWGIKRAFFKAFDNNDVNFEKLTSVFLTSTKQIPALPFHYLPFLETNTLIDEVHLKKKLEQIEKFNFKIIQQSRQEWFSYSKEDDHYKGNDILIKGFSEFIKQNKVNDACLILFEYGGDVIHSKTLIQELQISHLIIWLPKMPRKYIYHFIGKADLGVGILGRSVVTNCSIYEILSLSKPIMQTREDEYFKSSGFGELYPIFNVKDYANVAEQLKIIYNNPEVSKSVGQTSHDWILKKQEQRINGLLNGLKNRKGKVLFNHEFFSPIMKKPISHILDKIEIIFKMNFKIR